jgi:hypothetical protein
MRAARLSTKDSDMYLLIGYFYSWFSAVELAITFMLAQLGGFHRDLEAFEVIASGLQPRQKIERLRQLAKRANCQIGPNFDYFLKELLSVIDLRNQLSHSRLWVPKNPGHYQIRTLSKQEGKGARVIRALDLFAYGLWLHELAADLLDALRDQKSRPQILQIENPRNPVGRASNPKPPQPKPRASGSRPVRKRDSTQKRK